MPLGKGVIYMMQENDKIIVELKNSPDNENDILVFNFESPKTLNLNTCNNDDLKKIFSEVLKLIIQGNKKKFELKINDNYKKELFKDVFTEYIKIINDEIDKIVYE